MASLALGFTRYDIILPAKWVELENFRDLLADPLLLREMRKWGEHRLWSGSDPGGAIPPVVRSGP